MLAYLTLICASRHENKTMKNLYITKEIKQMKIKFILLVRNMINYFIHPLREVTKNPPFFTTLVKTLLTPTESPFAAFFGLVAVFSKFPYICYMNKLIGYLDRILAFVC